MQRAFEDLGRSKKKSTLKGSFPFERWGEGRPLPPTIAHGLKNCVFQLSFHRSARTPLLLRPNKKEYRKKLTLFNSGGRGDFFVPIQGDRPP